MSDEKIQYCPYCGRKIDPSYNFCPYCGRNITIQYHEDTKSGFLEESKQRSYGVSESNIKANVIYMTLTMWVAYIVLEIISFIDIKSYIDTCNNNINKLYEIISEINKLASFTHPITLLDNLKMSLNLIYGANGIFIITEVFTLIFSIASVIYLFMLRSKEFKISAILSLGIVPTIGGFVSGFLTNYGLSILESNIKYLPATIRNEILKYMSSFSIIPYILSEPRWEIVLSTILWFVLIILSYLSYKELKKAV